MTRATGEAFERWVSGGWSANFAAWRVLAGAATALASWAIFSFGVVLAARLTADAIGAPAETPRTPVSLGLPFPWDGATVFLTFGGLLLGVWLAQRLFHRQGLGPLLGGPAPALAADGLKAALAVALAAALVEGPALLAAEGPMRTALTLDRWALGAVVILPAMMLQVASEELLFRGYLPQKLALRWRSIWVWGLFPILLFAMGHYQPAGEGPVMAAAVAGATGLFAALALGTVYATGRLGAAIGAHLVNNLAAVLLVASKGPLDGYALWLNPVAPAGGFGDALGVVGGQALTMGLAAALLFAPFSPLRLRP